MINTIFLKFNKGFTMVETLVAVAILMISIAGPLTIANKGLTAAVYAKDQVIASFLAQDAMEYLKNYRDHNIIIGTPSFLASIYASGPTWNFCKSPTDVCAVDTTLSIPSSWDNPDTIILDANTPAQRLLYDSGTSYTHSSSGNKPTKFSRSYYITNASSTEATVVVEVEWKNGTVSNKVTLEDEIFNILR